MGINLLRDLGYDDRDVAVRKAREAAAVYAGLMDSLVDSRESAVSDLENGQDARLS